jgi:2'-5' RNA ligase
MTATTHRLFIASWPDETTRSAVMRAARPALAAAGGRPVDPAGLHVTLAFLGAVDAVLVQTLVDLLNTIPGAPYEYRFDRAEVWAGPRVLALAAAEVPAAASTLVASLWRSLEILGFTPERRPHRPHVTLARKVTGGSAPLALPAIVWPVRDLFLVESSATPAGSRYTPLASVDLVR